MTRGIRTGWVTAALAACLGATALYGCGGSSHSTTATTTTTTTTATSPSGSSPASGLLLRYEEVNHAGRQTFTLASAGGHIAIHRTGRIQLYDGKNVYVCKAGRKCELRASGRVAEEYKHLIFGTYLEPYSESLINRLPNSPSAPQTIAGVPSKCRTAKFSGSSWTQCVAITGGFVTLSHVAKSKALAESRLELLSAKTQVPPAELQLPEGT